MATGVYVLIGTSTVVAPVASYLVFGDRRGRGDVRDAAGSSVLSSFRTNEARENIQGRFRPSFVAISVLFLAGIATKHPASGQPTQP